MPPTLCKPFSLLHFSPFGFMYYPTYTTTKKRLFLKIKIGTFYPYKKSEKVKQQKDIHRKKFVELTKERRALNREVSLKI